MKLTFDTTPGLEYYPHCYFKTSLPPFKGSFTLFQKSLSPSSEKLYLYFQNPEKYCTLFYSQFIPNLISRGNQTTFNFYEFHSSSDIPISADLIHIKRVVVPSFLLSIRYSKRHFNRRWRTRKLHPQIRSSLFEKSLRIA